MSESNVAALNGLYKDVFGEIVDSIPDGTIFLDMVEFKQSDMIGQLYSEEVILANEHGYTYGGKDGDSYPLLPAISMQAKEAQIEAYSYTMKSSMSTTAASRSIKAGARGDKTAFKSAVLQVMQRALDSAGWRQEISMLYGQSPTGIGTILLDTQVDNAPTVTFTLTVGSFAPGIWSGAEGARIFTYQTSDGALVASGTGSFTIVAVDVENRTLTVSGTDADEDALIAAIDAQNLTIFFEDSKTKDMFGMDVQVTNLTGTIHGINATNFGLWKGNSIAVGGPMTQAILNRGIGRLVGRGLRKEKTCLMVNPDTWENMNTDQAALRSYDNPYSKKGESGFEWLMFHTQNGLTEVVSNPCVKPADAFLFPPKWLKRIGSADRDFALPGQEAEPFTKQENNAGFFWQNQTDVALYVQRPAICAKFTGIVNT